MKIYILKLTKVVSENQSGGFKKKNLTTYLIKNTPRKTFVALLDGWMHQTDITSLVPLPETTRHLLEYTWCELSKSKGCCSASTEIYPLVVHSKRFNEEISSFMRRKELVRAQNVVGYYARHLSVMERKYLTNMKVKYLVMPCVNVIL